MNETNSPAVRGPLDATVVPLVERLLKRRVKRWVHSTGDTPHASGYLPDLLCQEAAAEIERLRDALDQLLDDMGADGHCVCEDAKQQAIDALRHNDTAKRLARTEER